MRRNPTILRRGMTNLQFYGALMGCMLSLVVGFSIYQQSLDSQKADDAIDEVNIAVTALYSEYGGQQVDVGDVSLGDLTKGSLLPQRWLGKNGMVVSTPFDTPLSILPSVSYSGHDDVVIEMTKIPRAACLKMVQVPFGPQILDVSSVSGEHVSPGPMSPEEAERACPEAVNVIWWGVSLGPLSLGRPG